MTGDFKLIRRPQSDTREITFLAMACNCLALAIVAKPLVEQNLVGIY